MTAAKVAVAKEIGRQMWIPSTWQLCTLAHWQSEDEAVRHLWGKLAILLQRGNAAILANRVPEFPAPAIDGRY